MSKTFGTTFLTGILDILFPMTCLGCSRGLKGSREISYCVSCQQDIRLLRPPFCTICSIPFETGAGENHRCGRCLRHDWHFAQARSVVHYRPPVTEAVKMFKYNGRMYVLPTFAALARQYFTLHPLEEPDIIIPVPLHVARLRQRGFNQALILAKKLLPNWRSKIEPQILERHRWVHPQTGLSRKERRRNVKNAFSAARPGKIIRKNILLVDDVFTTGATVNECARILVKHQAARVDVFTFARALHPEGRSGWHISENTG